MRVKITKAAKLSPNGYDVIIVDIGDVVEGNAAECALRASVGEEIKPENTKPKKAPSIKEEKPKSKKPAKPKVKK